MKRDLPETMNSLQTCITFIKALGDSLRDYVDELSIARRSASELALDFESFSNTFQGYVEELQELSSPLKQSKTLLQNAGLLQHRAVEESDVFESEMPLVSYEIIKKRAKELSK